MSNKVRFGGNGGRLTPPESRLTPMMTDHACLQRLDDKCKCEFRVREWTGGC